MNQLANKYNHALAEIQSGNYEAAIRILQTLLQKLPESPVVNWTMALVKAYTGYPQDGLKYLGLVNKDLYPQANLLLEKLVESLPKYQQLFSRYNQSIELVKEHSFAEALNIIESEIDKNKEMPLPIEIYQCYMLLLLANGKESEFKNFYHKLPIHIQQNQLIDKFFRLLQLEESAQQMQQFKKKSSIIQWLSSGISIAAVAGLALVLITGGNSKETAKEPTDNQGDLAPSLPDDNENGITLEQLELQFSQLTNQNNELANELNNIENQLNEWLAFGQLVEDADVNVDKLDEQASSKQYQAGLNFYRNENYTQAIEHFTKAIQYNGEQYFSDDAHYYLIKSYTESHQLQFAREEINKFLSNTEKIHYKNSPYYDDILLVSAEIYILEGNYSKAIEHIGIIKQQFPDEWTSKAADKLEQQIQVN